MSEGQKHWLCAAVVPALYAATENRRIRALLRRLTLRFEGGAMYSLTVRDIYRKYHDLDVGVYTIGPCEAGPDNLAPGTSIGRYSSIYYTVRTMCGRDQQLDAAGPPRRLIIGNDVYIGHNAIILPTVERIGDGAFIGAGSVVQTSVLPYGVVMGNPARVVKYRFSEATIAGLLESKWWEKSLVELSREWETFQGPLDGGGSGPTDSAAHRGGPAVPTAVSVMTWSSRKDGQSSLISAGVLLWLYGRISSETVRRRLRKWILALEGGPGLSLSIRTILRQHHDLDVGLHSTAPCMRAPSVLHTGTTIGRYSTLADTVRTFTRDHPMNTKSSHAVFYNPGLGLATTGGVKPGRLEIGHGVSIGHNAIILATTKSIGTGAVIAPGAVVYRDVPPYAIVQGNPAQVVDFRYPKNVIDEILLSRWWEKPATEVGMPAERAAAEARAS